jgi:signal transduction histidine kinase
MKLSITARLALLAIGLALVSSLALAALIWQQTHDDAIGELRRDTIEQSDTFAAVYRSGGIKALAQAIDRAQADDDTLVVEVVDGNGHRLLGAGPDRLAVIPATSPFRIEVLGADGDWAAAESGFVIRPAGKNWLVSGRMLDDWERAQRAIEQALFLAVMLAIVLGIIGGLVLTRYVSRRLDRIAGAVDAVAAGDLGRRVETSGGDAFDRLGIRINGMLDRIDRLMAELRIVTDSVAHDLRSPIARLRARAETALSAEDEAQREAALAGLTAETDLVMRMLGVLLEISRTEAASRDAFAATNPAVLIEEIAELYAPVAEEAGLAFEVTVISRPSAPVPLHRELLSQAIANLIDNALRHALSGGSIGLSLSAAEGFLRIAVADRGPGIAEDDRAEALRRFGRLDQARSLPGAGLGLALVEAVARLHGGRLELADNAPGLVATLVLPLA